MTLSERSRQLNTVKLHPKMECKGVIKMIDCKTGYCQ